MPLDRILIVDDSPENRLVAAGHLEAAGFEIATVETGEQALAYLATSPADLVLLDVMMPGIGGFETCRRIRADAALADLPVLFLTALGDRATTQPALDAGGDDLLAKPFHRAELLLRVRALIRQHRTMVSLRETTRRLDAQNQALRALEEHKQRISRLIVHDLRGPTTAILHNAECLKSSDDISPDDLEVVGDILTSVAHLRRTVDDLLDVGRAAGAALTAKAEGFDLAELADSVVAAMRGVARYKRVEVVTDVRVDGLIADRDLVRRVLENLVYNATKYAPDESVVTIDAIRDGDDAIVVRVHDRGPGVPAADAVRIFEPYVTLDGAAATRAGHGLGLAFCRMAADAHAGAIWVESRATGGATFCVRFPGQAKTPITTAA